MLDIDLVDNIYLPLINLTQDFRIIKNIKLKVYFNLTIGETIPFIF